MVAALICYVFQSHTDERYAALATPTACFAGARPTGQRKRAAAEVCRQSGCLQTRSSSYCSRPGAHVRCPQFSLQKESVPVSKQRRSSLIFQIAHKPLIPRSARVGSISYSALNPSFCKGWVYFIQCGHIRDQWNVYRQSWVRQHVNPSEPTSLNCDVLHSDLKEQCVCTTDSVSFT